MNEKSNVTGLNNGANPRDCERAQEFVTYLYGEATPGESKAFEQHLANCAICRDELAAFGVVRGAVGEWKAGALSTVPSFDLGEALTPVAASRRAPEQRRSAWAALREFFSLSPLWMQAGALAAALVVCVLAALTFARTEVRWDSNGLAFRTGVKERVVEKERVIQTPVQTGYTQEQLNALLKENAEREVAAARAKWEADNNGRVGILEAALRQQRSATRGGATVARQQSPRRSAPGSSRGAQLAEVDPFSPREERVPRLTDLLGAVNTPQ
ncbi:MAG TPA: zf-HC2 domain-containing protein [Pyrinomonadaceae bacterium]|jgi:hypothetical protein|nr:zf-HC2 domain-containing protein [Pyrinomonadaceae bacterium]